MDAVRMHHLAVFQAFENVVLIIFGVAFHIGFLNATAGRSVVMRNSDADKRAVGQVYGALYESLAEGASPYNESAILILNSPTDNFGCRCGVSVNQYNYLAIRKMRVACGFKFLVGN